MLEWHLDCKCLHMYPDGYSGSRKKAEVYFSTEVNNYNNLVDRSGICLEPELKTCKIFERTKNHYLQQKQRKITIGSVLPNGNNKRIP